MHSCVSCLTTGGVSILLSKNVLMGSLLLSSLAFNASVLSAETCQASLSTITEQRYLTAQEAQAIRSERHRLSELVTADPANNLAVKHPFIIMNAYQRFEAINRKYPAQRVLKPGFGSEIVNEYPLYQEPLPQNGGKFIVSQHGAVQTFVEGIKAGANGDGSSVKTLTFEGGAGTGKTLFLEILAKVGEYHTQFDPDSYMYTFEWHDLAEIPALRDIARLVTNADGKVTGELPLESAIFESPFALLPRGMQDSLLRLSRDRVADLANVEPRPYRELNPQNEFVKNAILDYYAAAKGNGGVFSDEEIIDILEKHVTIKRFVLGGAQAGSKVGYQGRDIDWGGLIVTENPIIKSIYGAKHPFAYHYNGALLSAQGGILSFDELYRNMPAFLDFTLDVQESRVVSRGGLPPIHLDVIITAASNTESIEQVGNASGGTSKAQLDRSRIKPMRASIDPRDIYKTILLMKGLKNLRQRPLNVTDDAPALTTAFNLKQLFPTRFRKSDPYLMPERRFALSYLTGPRSEPISVAPWTIPLIAYVTAASRMVTDQQQGMEFGDSLMNTLNTQVFRDEVQRLKALIGDLNITAAQDKELELLSARLKEGNSGISARDTANIWFSEVLAASERHGADFTATPMLAKKVFLNILQQDGELKPKNNTQITHYLTLIDRVINEIILPNMEQDIDTALSEGLDDMSGVYDEVIKELTAIGNDPAATTYETTTDEVGHIDLKRLGEIVRLYQQTQLRPLEPKEILTMDAAIGRAGGAVERRFHPGLMRAIKQYHADLVLQQTSIDALLKFARNGEGNDIVRVNYDRLTTYLTEKLGYNRRALLDALQLVKEKKARVRQVR